mmetsp:Transcript_27348/g.45598  ORF Transcript_27348/g.45598 Transcript_27348/m.45598 type:complete len:162 (+) Transcript_27348:85-570(+)
MIWPRLLLVVSAPEFAAALSRDILLKVNLRCCDGQLLRDWLLRRPFASALPMQPMLVKQMADRNPLGVELTFCRKPSSEKGGTDGGLRFAVSFDDELDASLDAKLPGVLLVTRISDGQHIAKHFSERILVQMLLKDLASLPVEIGEVLSVLRPDQLLDRKN